MLYQVANKLSYFVNHLLLYFQQRAGVENLSLITMGKNLRSKPSELPDPSISQGQQKPEMTQSMLRCII